MERTAKKLYTYKDYARLPEGAPYQLIEGALVMTPAPTPYHQRISRDLEIRLYLFVSERGLGEVLYAPIDVYLSDTETYQPDILFIAEERLNIIGEQKIEGPPDLVMEILSPSTGYYDLRKKAKTYARCGVREYWIVDPEEKSIEIYLNENGTFTVIQRAEEKGKVQSHLLEGFEVDVQEVF